MNMRDNPGIVVPPPFIYLVFFLVGILFEKYVHLFSITYHPMEWIWVGLMQTSFIIAIVAFVQFVRVKTTILPAGRASTLITNGIFAYSRNPLYLSLFLFYVGLSLFLDMLWPLILSPVLVWVMNRFVIAKEEECLTRTFDQTYQEYCKRVRRWL
jgi:protein-S-isoprenylcysteine O-methyltransferase Ste14